MAIDITTDSKALSYADLICISNLLLAYSLNATINTEEGVARVAVNLARKIGNILNDMDKVNA